MNTARKSQGGVTPIAKTPRAKTSKSRSGKRAPKTSGAARKNKPRRKKEAHGIMIMPSQHRGPDEMENGTAVLIWWPVSTTIFIKGWHDGQVGTTDDGMKYIVYGDVGEDGTVIQHIVEDDTIWKHHDLDYESDEDVKMDFYKSKKDEYPPPPEDETDVHPRKPSLPRPPSPPPVAEDEQNRIVPCPVCGVRLKNSEVFAHLDSGECCGEAGPSEEATEAAVNCPICDALVLPSNLDAHIDSGCSAHVEAGSSSTGGPSQLQQEAPQSLSTAGGCSSTAASSSAAASVTQPPPPPPPPPPPDHAPLAEHLRCSICVDIFDDPHSLPCQHTFCHGCILECFRRTSQMSCPLCKAPCWKRQLQRNHQMAAIVKAFEKVAPQHAEEAEEEAAETEAEEEEEEEEEPPREREAQPPPPEAEPAVADEHEAVESREESLRSLQASPVY